jgi:hypothetical protein
MWLWGGNFIFIAGIIIELIGFNNDYIKELSRQIDEIIKTTLFPLRYSNAAFTKNAAV